MSHAQLQHALDQAVADGGPGAIAELETGGAKVWSGTAGVADLTTGHARRADEHFRIGSFTKAFVGTVVLGLAAEGGPGLDDPVARWLPGVVEEHLGGDSARITIRQLLNHTSGLPDAYPGRQPPAPEEPGKRFIYSKVNYNLAGLIVERATGVPLAEQIERRVARPLGLTGTYLPGTDNTLREPHARHYSKADELGRPADVHDVTGADLSWAGAAGGMVSTIADLRRFLGELLRGRLLAPEQQREMFTTVPTDGADWVPDTAYGLGVYCQRLPCGVTLWGGGGYIQGSVTYAMGDRDGGRILVGNLNGDWNDFLATFTALYQACFCR
ncbi:serine hydrolase domain-containing protein [Nonomuraea gerenzanensis]|uniref:D-alanyl-D-alanine carboxypeptidase n=1 Tax=Nonomuraea gerenzanensis TaxID=93944 RepID=A0A1M4EG07_9ACTN|nr:serine hydrolase domain-containing protein [Nonomuraea gerenzanensis]UBU09338.1 beta-lactamase family protein [Nonomuraea gerenzanensis]SBO97750.1 D-alanyl-D-alanine carboxypeptidase [Nonomuraea gerenzanensis]